MEKVQKGFVADRLSLISGTAGEIKYPEGGTRLSFLLIFPAAFIPYKPLLFVLK